MTSTDCTFRLLKPSLLSCRIGRITKTSLALSLSVWGLSTPQQGSPNQPTNPNSVFPSHHVASVLSYIFLHYCLQSCLLLWQVSRFTLSKVYTKRKTEITCLWVPSPPSKDCQPLHTKRAAFSAVFCYPFESFSTNRLHHLFGNLPECHVACSTPVFSHVTLSPFSLCLMAKSDFFSF